MLTMHYAYWGAMGGSMYVCQIPRVVRQTLLELPRAERLIVGECLRTELTGAYGDQTTQVAAWHLHLAQLPGPHWSTILTCGMLAIYRRMTPDEVLEWESRSGRTLDITGFYVVYLMVDVDPSGAQ